MGGTLGEEVIPRFDYVVFDTLRLMNRAKVSKDYEGYLNAVEQLVHLAHAFSGEEEAKKLARLEEEKARLKRLVLKRADALAASTHHPQKTREITRRRDELLKEIELQFAGVEEIVVYEVLMKRDIIQVPVSRLKGLEELLEIVHRAIDPPLTAFGVKLGGDKSGRA